MCSNASLVKTVATRQYFTTLDDAELDKLGGSCREYTLPRDDQSSQVKGWIRGNTKISPVLEVAVSYHQGRYGIEIMINSLFGDGTRSWVMIVNGINKYVTPMTLESTGRSVAPARPKQTPRPTSSSSTTTLHYHGRVWIDVEPGLYDKSCFEVSKKMIRLLRHNHTVPREKVWAVEFRTLASMLHSKFTSSPCWSIRTWLNYLQRGGGAKKRYQYCVTTHDETQCVLMWMSRTFSERRARLSRH